MDAHYVHPLETFIGLMLFLWSIPIVGWIGGAPIHVVPGAIAMVLFTQLNQLNHIYTRIEKAPWGVVDYITGVHRAHHVDMNHGNFATLTMVYDKLFGTYEEPVHREAA